MSMVTPHTHTLTIALGDAADLRWAQATVTAAHYLHATGAPIPGPSGKYGWAWRLPAPQWCWQDLDDIRPRTLRLI